MDDFNKHSQTQTQLQRSFIKTEKSFKQNFALYAWRHREEMAMEEIIQQILVKRPDVSREQVLDALGTEKNKTGGLIADATLLRLIAAKYGVEIPRERIADHKLSVALLVPNLNDVTVTGRIVAVYSAKTFEGAKPGKYASLMIADDTGILRVMLWNDKASLVESGELKAGQVVRLSHGYTREDRNGKAELHIGGRSEVEINPQDSNAENYPSISRFATRIKEIAKPQQNIHLAGRVKEVFPSSTFTRQDQSTGKVLRFTLADDTGELAVVVWNEKAEELEAALKKDAQVQLVNAKVKATSAGFEAHVDASTYAAAR
jgi:replication factor A1